MRFVNNLNAPILRLSPFDVMTLEQAFRSIHIFGGTGSGKTSGSGKAISGALLRAGCGACITAVKPDEIPLWQNYAQQHGRAASLVLFDENEGFNFLAYEMEKQGLDGIGTVTECLLKVLEAAKRASPTASQKGSEEIWESSKRQLLRYTLLPLYAATGELTIPAIIRFMNTAPTNSKEPRDAQWQKNSFMYAMMNAAVNRPKVKVDHRTLRDVIDFWAEEYPAIPDKTRGSMLISTTTVLDRFKHGRLRRAFCEKTSIVPELSFHGVCILLAMPTLTWQEDGVIAQQLFKFMWQRAVLSRNSLDEKHRERPLFLWSDESQDTVSSYDGEFLGLCRSSRCAVVYLTQTLPNYYSKIGGDNPRDAANALVGKFNTNIFHSNACPETNEYASKVIGKIVTRRNNASVGQSVNFNDGMNSGENENRGISSNYGSSHSGGFASTQGSHGSNSAFGSTQGNGSNWGVNRSRGKTTNENRGYSESMEFAIEPGDFARILRTGGPENDNLVTGVWFQAGRIFKASGTNILMETFKQ